MLLVRNLFCLFLCGAMQAAVAADQSVPKPGQFEEAIARGQYNEAERLAIDALKALAQTPDFSLEDVVQRHLRVARSASLRARWAEASRLQIALESGMRNALLESSPLWLELHTEQIALHRRIANYPVSDRAYSEARQRVAKHPRLSSGREFVQLLTEQVESLKAQGRTWDAIEALQEKLDWFRRHDEANAVEIGSALTALAELNGGLQRMQTSKALLEQAEKLLEPLYRRRASQRREEVSAMTSWAVVANKVWESCKLREELVRTVEQELGANNPKLIHPLVDAASMCEEDIGGGAREKMFRRALAIATTTWGPSHPDVLHALENQGTYFATREYSESDEGEVILATALRLRHQIYAEAPAVVHASALHDLADLTKNMPESCTSFATGHCKAQILPRLERLASAWGEKHPALALLRTEVIARVGGFTSSAASDRDDAARYEFVEEQCDIAFDAAVAGMGSDHPQTGEIARQCGEFLVSVRKYRSAERLYAHATTVYTKHFGESEYATREVRDERDRMRSMVESR